MKKSDFYYDLPENLIAQHPAEPRNSARLLVMNRKTGEIKHSVFKDLFDFLEAGDCLILNDTRVLPARIYGTRTDTSSKVEFLLLKDMGNNAWECIAGPGKKAKVGHKFIFSEKMSGEVTEVLSNGNRIVQFITDGEFMSLLDEIGEMPLPHYITAELDNPEDYQTVYSKIPGSAAAPTAGLHFTDEMLADLQNKGIKIGYVTLHVGLGTFRPVKVEDITEHHMHSEHYSVPEETVNLVESVKKAGHKVICVGTTSCRTVESSAQKTGKITAGSADTDIFIYPGYEFKVMDGIITNFHLPESTLIMLVSAFAGYENTMNCYNLAVKEKYRFFSFGDCMAIL